MQRRSWSATITPHSDPSPSPDDVQVTRMIVEAGTLLNIDVLDHIIVTRGRAAFVSASKNEAIRHSK